MRSSGGRTSVHRLAAIGLTLALNAPAVANTFTFLTPSGAGSNGVQLQASATFVTSADQVTVTLVNLSSNPGSIGEALGRVVFDTNVVSAGSASMLVTPAANYISIAKDDSVTAGACCARWQLNRNGSIYELTGRAGKGAGGTGPGYLILGSGPYTNANGSIAGNRPHNPFIDTSATFTLAIAGVTSDTTISGVVFGFGTDASSNVAAAVPLPATAVLFLPGLAALVAVARRKAASVSPRHVALGTPSA